MKISSLLPTPYFQDSHPRAIVHNEEMKIPVPRRPTPDAPTPRRPIFKLDPSAMLSCDRTIRGASYGAYVVEHWVQAYGDAI